MSLVTDTSGVHRCVPGIGTVAVLIKGLINVVSQRHWQWPHNIAGASHTSIASHLSPGAPTAHPISTPTSHLGHPQRAGDVGPLPARRGLEGAALARAEGTGGAAGRVSHLTEIAEPGLPRGRGVEHAVAGHVDVGPAGIALEDQIPVDLLLGVADVACAVVEAGLGLGKDVGGEVEAPGHGEKALLLLRIG